MNTDDLEAAYYLPGDGMTNPVDTTQALAQGARIRGAMIFEGVLVTNIHTKNGAISGVSTDRG